MKAKSKASTRSSEPITVLFHTVKGRTYLNIERDTILIEFGNMLLSLDYPLGLTMFKEFVYATDLRDTQLYQPHLRRKLVLQMAGHDMCYCFSNKEFIELKDLLEGTYAMLELEEILYKTCSFPSPLFNP